MLSKSARISSSFETSHFLATTLPGAPATSLDNSYKYTRPITADVAMYTCKLQIKSIIIVEGVPVYCSKVFIYVTGRSHIVIGDEHDSLESEQDAPSLYVALFIIVRTSNRI